MQPENPVAGLLGGIFGPSPCFGCSACCDMPLLWLKFALSFLSIFVSILFLFLLQKKKKKKASSERMLVSEHSLSAERFVPERQWLKPMSPWLFRCCLGEPEVQIQLGSRGKRKYCQSHLCFQEDYRMRNHGNNLWEGSCVLNHNQKCILLFLQCLLLQKLSFTLLEYYS